MAKKSISKKRKTNVESNETLDVKVLDKTNMSFYLKEETNQVIFSDTISNMIEGKGETYSFTNCILSSRILTKKDKEVESKKFILFILDDGNYALANKWNAL